MAIGRTNTGGGGTGATLTVTAPAGVTVTVSRDGKTYTKTANADGLAVFRGLKTGTWVVTITDGVQTSTPKVVEVTADYAATMSFSVATINVTYAIGAVCTATNGDIKLEANDTSGVWELPVPVFGDWTITDGTETKTVSVTEGASAINVNIRRLYLFQNGDECASVTGGYLTHATSPGYAKLDGGSIKLHVDGSNTNTKLTQANSQNKLQRNNYTKLVAMWKKGSVNSSATARVSAGISSDTTKNETFISKASDNVSSSTSSDIKTLVVDIPNTIDEFYLKLQYKLTSEYHSTNILFTEVYMV